MWERWGRDQCVGIMGSIDAEKRGERRWVNWRSGFTSAHATQMCIELVVKPCDHNPRQFVFKDQ